MSGTQRTPVVPLEAGAGPENPPCPACGEPLFGWIDARPGLAGPVSRCESCGLGVVDAPGDPEAALRELDHQASAVPFPRIGGERNSGSVVIANRAGFSAWIGGAGWAGLQPGSRYLFTEEAARRLVARRDQVVRSARWAPVAGVAAMWQTLLNSATFGNNLVFGTSTKAEKPWQRQIDWLATVVLAVPALAISLPLELAAAALRRGGTLTLELKPL